MGKRPELEIMNGPLSGKRFSVKAGGLRLGRSSSNDIQIPDEELSRNHCLFELTEGDGIRVTDLASANGTIVNGTELKNDPATLKPGDVIEVGQTVIHVIGPGGAPAKKVAAAGAIDLGLNGQKLSDMGKDEKRRRSPFALILWLVALACIGAAAYVVFFAPKNEATTDDGSPLDENPAVREVIYEKVEADATKIFRYEMTLSADNVMKIVIDSVPDENRHVVKSQVLDEKAVAELNKILSFNSVREIDREYAGTEVDPPALNSWYLKIIYATRVRSIRITNTQEPETFRAIREKLETFAKNQLGVWALQYPKEKLVSLAEESITLARAKWDDRDVQHGNIHGAIKAFEEAIFYLDTVNPKPDCFEIAVNGLKKAKEELERRYNDQRFLADRAINLKQWRDAQRELSVLLELVPDRSDERNREASSKLIDVERRMKGGN